MDPIKEGYQENDGWMDIKKVTVFIGNQGSGKSTVAKTISVLSWLEKAINRGDINRNLSFNEFVKHFQYQKIHNYFSKNTIISYQGEKYHILYDATFDYPVIEAVDNESYLVPKIMYVPAERSFLSALNNAFELKELPGNIFDFAVELKNAQKQLSGKN
ncbi:MAG: ATP-binding protein [Bacteroidales bacterium]|nr:ATP-binding protein [Bacteroidales bacterium]